MIDLRLKKIFIEIIKIEGLSGREKNVAKYISNFLKKLNLNPIEDKSYLKTKSNTGNIICKVGNGGDYVLCSHMDTARSTQGVKPIIKKDRIMSDGRTVLGVDNRAGISVLLYLVEKIIKEKASYKDFTLVFTTCEETTLGGSRSLELSKRIKRGYIFDSYQAPGKYINSSFGAAGFSINIWGKAAHSGIEPEKGIDALQIAVKALSKIKTGRLKDDTTINFGKIEGGTATNVVPDKIFLNGEVRSNTMEKVEKHISTISQKFEEATKSLNGKMEFKWEWDFKPYRVSSNSQIILEIINAITNANLEPIESISKGGSDANTFNEKGIQSINLGIGAQNPHSNDEFILLDDLQNTLNIAYELVRKK
ncbi:MAG: M20/M25/M40 family metallo-hydrolase [Bacteroidetes bacterium]|nr:M20/M25/M40 family metallo-hydrolase [Bacteroidota bacterium]MBU1113941.1 M20/M25/M40 family metallo-hydrolase [Bacteroidota bacterium]MBU1798264.1 M20/M25/M40 family metallo-hydrolase [Bacteroidota bacterium]